jgi:hypothetical protein
MRIYTIYSSEGKVVLSTFDEDIAWARVDFNVGEYVDTVMEND